MTYLTEIERRSRALWQSLFPLSDGTGSAALSQVNVFPPIRENVLQPEEKASAVQNVEKTDGAAQWQDRLEKPSKMQAHGASPVSGTPARVRTAERSADQPTDRPADQPADRPLGEGDPTPGIGVVLRGIDHAQALVRRMAAEHQNAVYADSPLDGAASAERSGTPPAPHGGHAPSDTGNRAASALWEQVARTHGAVKAAERNITGDTVKETENGRSAAAYRAEDWSLSFERDARRYDGGFTIL